MNQIWPVSKGWLYRWLRSRGPVVLGCSFVLFAASTAGFAAGVRTSQLADEAWFGIEFIILVGSLWGSWLVARHTTRQHAKSAFNRLRSLYAGLARICQVAGGGVAQGHDSEYSLSEVATIASIHLQTVDDALDDWSHLVPREVAELSQSLQESAVHRRS